MPIKLYHGTSEIIAKAAPTQGLLGLEIALTTVYGAYQAFITTKPDERWGLIEICADDLPQKNLLPCNKLIRCKNHTWKKSLDMVGFCLHSGSIPSHAIGKVWIYNPQSNWLITRTILHAQVGMKYFEKHQKKLSIINRWLTGEFINVEEWLVEQKDQFTPQQKEELRTQWGDRSGLDLFYHGS